MKNQAIQKAYSILKVTSVDEEQRVIEGIATTPTPDRVGDIIEPLGVKFKLPLPLLLYHNSEKPVGNVEFLKPTRAGIPFRASLPKVTEEGTVKTRIDEAWHSLKYKLIGAVSIGFRPINDAIEFIENGLRFLETELLELSLVVIPAQPDAVITGIKSFDTSLRAALGAQEDEQVKTAPTDKGKSSGATEKKIKPVKLSPKEGKKMNINEQIKQYQAELVTIDAQLDDIVKRSAESGETPNAEDEEKEKDLEADRETVLKHIERLQKAQKRALESAKAVQANDVDTAEKAADARSNGTFPVYTRKHTEEKFKGQSFTRMAIAKAIAVQRGTSASAIAEHRWGKTNPELVQWIKANEVAGGGTGSGEWGAELVGIDNRFTGDFIEFLYGQTAFFRLPLREVPARVSIKGQDGAATGYFVGESKAIPMSKPDFSNVELGFTKVAAITSLSNELIEASDPSAEMLVRDALANACSVKVDTLFFSTTAASAGVAPAGILNGLGSTTSFGATADDVRDDIKTLYAPFLSAKNATGLVFAMQPALAKSIQLMRNSLGQKEFPDINANTGGNLEGDPVYLSDNITTGHLILLKPSDIWRIGMSGLQITASREATIEQNSVPAGASDTPAASANTPVSMFQTESTAFKAVMPVNWQKRRTSAVAYITDADYGALESGS